MEKAFTQQLNRTMTCKKCKAEIPKQSLFCNACGAKNTYPEFLAALIIGGLGVMALYSLYQF